jgi:hypothetical protein
MLAKVGFPIMPQFVSQTMLKLWLEFVRRSIQPPAARGGLKAICKKSRATQHEAAQQAKAEKATAKAAAKATRDQAQAAKTASKAVAKSQPRALGVQRPGWLKHFGKFKIHWCPQAGRTDIVSFKRVPEGNQFFSVSVKLAGSPESAWAISLLLAASFAEGKIVDSELVSERKRHCELEVSS